MPDHAHEHPREEFLADEMTFDCSGSKYERQQVVELARHWVKAVYERHSLDPDIGVLVVSEAVTNVVEHTTSISCKLAVYAPSMRIEVRDSSYVTPVVQPQRLDTETGRGMLIISYYDPGHHTTIVNGGKILCVQPKGLTERAGNTRTLGPADRCAGVARTAG